MCYVILGATGGVGSELARRLATKGKLMLAARDRDKLQELSSSLGAESVVVEATEASQIEACIKRAIEVYGKIDGLANCFGSLMLKPAHLTTDAEWSTTVAINLTSSFAALRTAAKLMTDGGSIVFVSSAAARIGLANHEAIAAAKAGIIGLVLSAAASYASRNIRVNCVAPGLVKTPLTSRITSNEAALRSSLSLHALSRVGEPAKIASAIEWLLLPEQDWITGQVIGVDGGLSTVKTRSN